MKPLHKTTLILGEGVTEFYYFNSLRDVIKGFTVQPDYPKHANLIELKKEIKRGIELGYDTIFCVIDMDTKEIEPEKSRYASLKKEFDKPIINKKKDINCVVKFFETHRCTELFFLYYFKYTTHRYPDQDHLLKDLNTLCGYQKNKDFFDKCKGLHSYFERKGGSLDTAILRAEKSVVNKAAVGGDCSYSELGRMIKELL